jgi:hypothetical protein
MCIVDRVAVRRELYIDIAQIKTFTNALIETSEAARDASEDVQEKRREDVNVKGSVNEEEREEDDATHYKGPEAAVLDDLIEHRLY